MLLASALNNPLLNLGVGLLSASGPSTTPISMGQAIAMGVQNMQADITTQSIPMKNLLFILFLNVAMDG